MSFGSFTRYGNGCGSGFSGGLVRRIALVVPEPGAPLGGVASGGRCRFLSEGERYSNLGVWYPLLLRLSGIRGLRWTDFRSGSYVADAETEWEPYFAAMPGDARLRPAIREGLLPAYAFADRLAVHHIQLYRSAYVFNFAAAALAVAVALVGLFAHDIDAKARLVGLELAVILAILVTWQLGWRCAWHRRGLDYRRLAEWLRHMRVLGLTASQSPVPRPGRSLDKTGDDWVSWYARAVRRLLPLPNRMVDADYVAAVRDRARHIEIAGQLSYHRTNETRMAALDRRLHWFGTALFVTSLALGCAFLAAYGLFKPCIRDPVLNWLTYLSAFLPTLGAAVLAIRVQGDFETVAHRSERTAERLAALDAALGFEPLEFARLADRVEKAADVMTADLAEWEVFFRTRPLSLPA